MRLRNISKDNFLWPLSNKKKGFFYSDKTSYKEIERIHRNLIKINITQWKKQIKVLKKNLMCFEYRNETLKKIIKKEIGIN